MNNIFNQTGGYNICDETNPEYLLPKIKKILEELETDNKYDFDAYNRISEKFYKCYDVLIDDFYAKNELYYQTIDGIKGDRPIYKLHINYSALILLCFLVELHCFLLIHGKIEMNVSGNMFTEKRAIEVNTIKYPYNNILERPFFQPPDYPERYFVYKNTLPNKIVDKKGIIQCLNIFCRELTMLRNNIFTVLIKRLFERLNLMIEPEYRFKTINDLKNIIFFGGNYENVFENWRENLMIFVTIHGQRSYQEVLDEIYNCVVNVLKEYSWGSQLNNAKFLYDPDVNGFFEWTFLDSIQNCSKRDQGFNLVRINLGLSLISRLPFSIFLYINVIFESIQLNVIKSKYNIFSSTIEKGLYDIN